MRRSRIYAVSLVGALGMVVVGWAGARAAVTDVGHYDDLITRRAVFADVYLAPQLEGGTAGWCMAIGDTRPDEGGSDCAVPATSTGPIFAQQCLVDQEGTDVFAFTKSNVAAIEIARHRPIPTLANATLPNSLRAVAVEVQSTAGVSRHRSTRCLSPTPLNSKGDIIDERDAPGVPLEFRLPARRWRSPAREPGGGCRITAKAGSGVTAQWGSVAKGIRAYPQLIGNALLSCANVMYFNVREDRYFDVAVLVDAAHPGSEPAALRDMAPVSGHAGIGQLPGVEGEIVARRIPGAWLVVEESDRLGLATPLALLEDVRVEMEL